MAYNQLTPEETTVIVGKATEMPFDNEYDNFFQDGIYICRRCNNPLFPSKAKFEAGCGCSAFDKHFPNAVKTLPDPDGQRTEIECAHCGAHLGHVFTGEKFTDTDTRHCVNSLSIRFVPKDQKLPKILNKEEYENKK